jgi:hypothetical protein
MGQIGLCTSLNSEAPSLDDDHSRHDVEFPRPAGNAPPASLKSEAVLSLECVMSVRTAQLLLLLMGRRLWVLTCRKTLTSCNGRQGLEPDGLALPGGNVVLSRSLRWSIEHWR